jgi:hypothetical protein
LEATVILSYLLIALTLALMGVVATSKTRFAPIIVALALVSNILSVEMARGWAAWMSPPRQGVLYAAMLGEYIVASEGLESPLRLYKFKYSPAIEGMLKDGPKMYDMDHNPGEGEALPGRNIPGGGFDPDDLTSLEEEPLYGTK